MLGLVEAMADQVAEQRKARIAVGRVVKERPRVVVEEEVMGWCTRFAKVCLELEDLGDL